MSNVSALLLRDSLIRNDQICPQRTAVIDGNVTISYRELLGRVDSVCAALWSLGVRPGDRVGILLENSVEYIELLLAMAHMRSIAVPLNTRLTASELQFILNDAGAGVLITSPALKPLAEETWAQVGSIRHGLVTGPHPADGRFASYQAARSTAAPFDPGMLPDWGDDATVILLYTSGTTGLPKGCMTTDRSWLGNNTNMAMAFAISATDRYLALLPFFHVAGIGTLLAHLHAGGTVVPLAKYSPAGVAQMIAHARITLAFLVPPMIQQLLSLEHRAQYDFTSLRAVIGGVGFEPPWVSEQVEEELQAKFFGIYGQSEAGNIVTAATRDDIAQRASTYGYELPGFRVRIVDDADNPVPVGVAGELTLRGPSLMKGYWNREEATQEALRGDWLHTGDIFLRQPDGMLEMIDRKKYLIKTGGENVYPAEVERILSAHPAVADVSVIGIAHPVWGEAVKACVVLRPGHTPSRTEVAAWCRQRLAGYKIPRYIEWVPEIPRNHSGKPLKNLLQARPTDSSQDVSSLH
ncbi:MAG: AMP-binding protein [Thermaerobacter sp.]|nr:AMP-binding protein [Thermaerobacter sp.]